MSETPKDGFERNRSGEIFDQEGRSTIEASAAHFITELARNDRSRKFNERQETRQIERGREIEGRDNALLRKGQQPSGPSIELANKSFSDATQYRESARIAGLEADSTELQAVRHFNGNTAEYIQTAREEATRHGINLNLPPEEQQVDQPSIEAHQSKAA